VPARAGWLVWLRERRPGWKGGGGLPQFLSQWLGRDPGRLAPSLKEFTGHPAYGLDQLRGDLERFVFLLSGSDGEPLFGP
jgi:hypothetical protein